MAGLNETDLLAVHLHRALNGEWYAVGTFVDKSVGKNGQRILAPTLAPFTVGMIAGLIETEKFFTKSDGASTPPDTAHT